MELIMLGTGNAGVANIYNTCFVLKGEKENLLVDAGGGNGIFGRLNQAGIALSSVRDMYITHSHTD
ncbi:MAG: MBL fold metallo-hydrolase, partial [Selenomonadales bacterium]|nr:MBL fold metallo-hydrolase [Selenomonadales bacterium]